MINETAPKDKKVDNPATRYKDPIHIVKDKSLSHQEKEDALDTWEQDSRQLLTASNEGMTGSDEGHTRDDAHKLGAVVRAKDKLGEKPKQKPSQ